MKQKIFIFLLFLLIIMVGCSGDKTQEGLSSNSSENIDFTQTIKTIEESSINLTDLPVQYFPEGDSKSTDISVFESDEPFIITDFGPDGELPSELEYPSVWVLFSQPVIPLSKLGTPSNKSQILKIEPPLEGVFRWYGTKLLSFEASQKGLPQHIYNVSLSDQLMSLGGKSLSGTRGFSFHTEYLSIISADPGRGGIFDKNEVPVSEASKITIHFNYPVNLEVVSKYLRVNSNNKNYKFTISRPKDPEGIKSKEELSRIAVLEIRGNFDENSTVLIKLKKGARSESHYIGTPDEQELSFKTYSSFVYTKSSAGSYSFPGSSKGDSNPIFLKFSHPVEDRNLSTLITSYPDLLITESNISVWKNTIRISNLSVEYDKNYTFLLSPEISDIYGRKLNKRKSVSIDIPEAYSYALFPNLGTRMLESSFTPKIIYEFQNLFDGDWMVDSIEDPYSSFGKEKLIPYDFTGIKENVRHFEVKDLSPWLSSAGTGWVGFSWNFEKPAENGIRPDWGKQDLQVQVTDLAVTTRYGYNRVVTLISSLSTGKVIEGAKVSLMRDREIVKQTFSDKSGLALFYMEDNEYTELFSEKDNPWKDHLRLRIETDSDSIEFIPNYSHNIWHMGIYSSDSPLGIQQKHMETFLFTDRGLYRPGETVSFRGIDRNLNLGEYSSFIGPYTVQLKEASYTGDILAEDNGYSSDSGGFYGSFELGSNLAPGYYRLIYSRNGGSKEISFHVANFERLSFEVNMEKPDLIQYPEKELKFKLSSGYLSGGVLSDASYNYSWTKTPDYYRPPGLDWDGWSFGPGVWDQRHILSSGEGLLGPDGKAEVMQKPTQDGVLGLTYNYNLEVRVQDKSNQEVSKRLSAVVHPGSYYIALKLQDTGWSSFVEKGESAFIEYTLVDPLGDIYLPPDTDIKMELIYKTWNIINQQGVGGNINTSYQEVEELEISSIIKSGVAEGNFEIKPLKSGSYIVRLSGKDQKGREIITNLSLYSTGGDWIRWGRNDNQDINLVSNKEIYKPGETAKLIIKSPLPEGNYLITTEREGIFDERVVFLEGGAQVIGIPIEENYIPVVYVAVSAWSKRSTKPSHNYFSPDLDKPKGYFGIIPLHIDPELKTFNITVETDKSTYMPGDEVELKIKTNSQGRPLAGAEITFMAVDRGVLDLINYHVPDPVGFFYSRDKFLLGTGGADSRSLLMDPVTYEVKDLMGGDSEDGKMDLREDFNPTAIFEPYIITNSRGEALFNFTLPDNLTTYRFTAIGVKDNKFGIQEGEIHARNPLNVKSLIPSRLRYRDTVISGVSITNLTDVDEKVSITASSDLLSISGDDHEEILIKAGQTEIVKFSLSAGTSGNGSVRFSIRSNVLNEDLQTDVIVEKSYIRETLTTAGRILNSVTDTGRLEETLIIPSIAEDGIGSLSLTLSPGFGGELKSASEYLLEYPYNCFEQRSSKIIPQILFENTGTISSINNEISLMARFQNDDGGIPFWPEAGYRSSYYVSLRVAHLLYLLKEDGIELENKPNMDKLLFFLNKPDKWSENSNYLMAFRYYLMALYNKNISGARALLSKGDELGHSSYAMLGLAFSAAGDELRSDICLERIKKFIQPGTRTISLTQTFESKSFYASETETYALLLMLLRKRDPDSEMLMRIANTLSLNSRNGYWGNTADTAWAMLSLSGGTESAQVDFSAEAEIAGNILSSANFKNSNENSVEEEFNFNQKPLLELDRDTALPLSIEKSGPGNLFYTAALSYALPSEILTPRDEGIGLYSIITNLEGDIVDSSHLTAGKTYIRKVTVSSHRDREYLSVRVPVPSGASILDASFVSSAEYAEYEEDEYAYIYNPPRMEIMDNEVRYFYDSFTKGKQEVEFYFRAVSTGIYPTPPVQAECMYQPEIFGRTSGQLIIIDEK
jgi:alpha-2-macroglobulin